MPGLEYAAAAVLPAVARTTGDLVPYLIVIGTGFLLGAWGQSARVPVAVAGGILLILIGTGGFLLDNDSGGGGVPGAKRSTSPGRSRASRKSAASRSPRRGLPSSD